VPTSRFEEALAYAYRLHSSQLRKGSGIPYVSHLLAVCSLVMEYGGGEDEAIAALLHDAIEDQGVSRAEIRKRFGSHVTEIVDGCTDADTVPKPAWRPRKEAYIARLGTAPRSIRLVIACDKLHNVRSLIKDYREQGEDLWDHFTGGREGTLWYYRAVVTELSRDGIVQLFSELERTVSEFESLVAPKS
jgi:(p)ppGpp synthase/HD superfamily hydrolase